MTDILIRSIEMSKDSPVYLTVCPSGGVYVHTYERGYGALVKSQYRVIELPEHGDLIEKQTALAALHSDYAYAAMDIIEKEVPVVIPSNKEDAG